MFDDPVHARPLQMLGLAAAAQTAMPQPGDLERKAFTRSLFARGPVQPRQCGCIGVAFGVRRVATASAPRTPKALASGHGFAAPYPARAYLCQRFAHTLADVHA